MKLLPETLERHAERVANRQEEFQLSLPLYRLGDSECKRCQASCGYCKAIAGRGRKPT